MDAQKYQERVQIYQDAMHGKKPKRVPTLSNAWGWKIHDCDAKPTFEEATSNWEVMEKVVREHMERYHFDSASEVGFRFNSSYRIVLGDRSRHDAVSGQALDHTAMKADEYGKLAAMGGAMFEWTTLFPRLFGDLTFGELEQLIGLYGAFGQFVGKMYQALVNDYSMPILAPLAVMTPMEELFNYYRGIKGLSTDMRRNPQGLLEYIEKDTSRMLAEVDNAITAPHDICAFCIPFLAPTVLNSKQFEKFYWPSFKTMVDRVEERGDSVYLFVEGESARFADYFKEFKQGTFIVHVEMDDFYEVRKLLPNTCLAGGMPVSLLGGGTRNQCIEEAKRLCDELGDTGYVFSQNKMLAYPNDATRENMLAVQEFVTNYHL